MRTATATSASSRATWARWCSRSCSRRPNSVSALAATPPSSARPPPDPQADLTRNSHPHVHTFSALKGYRSEEHTSELQSRGHLVCRLLLEKKIQKKAPPAEIHSLDVRRGAAVAIDPATAEITAFVLTP